MRLHRETDKPLNAKTKRWAFPSMRKISKVLMLPKKSASRAGTVQS